MKNMRTHRPSSLMPIVGYLVTELLRYVEKYQIPLFDNVKVTDILSDNGQVTGIKAESDREIEIKTSAVILATGGFGAGKDLLAQYRSEERRVGKERRAKQKAYRQKKDNRESQELR